MDDHQKMMADKRLEVMTAVLAELTRLGHPAKAREGRDHIVDFGDRILVAFSLEPPTRRLPRWRAQIGGMGGPWCHEAAGRGFDYPKMAEHVLATSMEVRRQQEDNRRYNAAEEEADRIEKALQVRPPFAVRATRAGNVALQMSDVAATEEQIATIVKAARACGLIKG